MKKEIEKRIERAYSAVLSPFATPDTIKAELEGLIEFGRGLPLQTKTEQEVTWDMLQASPKYWRSRRK